VRKRCPRGSGSGDRKSPVSTAKPPSPD
jgi:hypothetical protein